MNDDLVEKISEHDRNDVKIGAKLFLNQQTTVEKAKEALDSLFDILHVEYVDNLVLSVGTEKSGQDETKAPGDGYAKLDKNSVQRLKEFWKLLESYANDKKVTFTSLFDQWILFYCLYGITFRFVNWE